MKHIFQAKIEDKQLVFLEDTKSYFDKLENRNIVVTINIDKKRSLPQNSYYWKLLEIIGEDIGYESEDMHEIFKHKFLKKEKEVMIKGKPFTFEKTISTTKLTTAQFTEYIEKIKRFCAVELAMYLPDANDAYISNTITKI